MPNIKGKLARKGGEISKKGDTMPKDETKDADQNTPKKDTSGKGSGTTPSKSEKKISDEELDKLLIARGSHVGRENTRLKEKIASFEQEQSSNATRMGALERSVRESKLNRDDPSAIKNFQAGEDIIEREEAVSRRERAAKARESEQEEKERDIAEERITTIAETYGVDAEELRGLGITNRESLIKYAKATAPEKEGDKEGVKGKKEGGEGDFTPDSNTQSDSEADSLELSEEEMDSITPKELARRQKVLNPDLLT